MVFYESRKLNANEHNYVTRYLELEMIIHDFKMWMHYHLGRSFVLMSDHNGLRYLFEQPNLNVRKARWLAMISNYDFDTKYIKERKTGLHMLLVEEFR